MPTDAPLGPQDVALLGEVRRALEGVLPAGSTSVAVIVVDGMLNLVSNAPAAMIEMMLSQALAGMRTVQNLGHRGTPIPLPPAGKPD